MNPSNDNKPTLNPTTEPASTPAVDSAATTTPAPAPLPWWKKLLKISAWTVMGLFLFFVGLVFAVVTILSPERLTPIVTSIANNNLNADVSIGRAELTLASSFPMLNINVDDISLISRDTRRLSADYRDEMGVPEYADSLLSIKSVSGGINLKSLISDKIQLSDVIIDSPRANLVIVNDSVSNFNIFQSTDTTATDFASLPEVAINRFEIKNPGPVRYYDCETGTQFQADFQAVDLVGSNAPLYALRFEGNIDAPLLMEYFHFDDLRFGLVGNIRWSQKKPYNIGLDNFDFRLSFLKGRISTDIDATNQLIVNSLDFKLDPFEIDKVIHLLPDEMAEALAEENGIPYSIFTNLETSARLQVSARLLKPFNAAVDGLPCIEANIQIPESYLKWENLDIQSMKASMTLLVPDGDPDNSSLTIEYLDLTGPATDIHIKGRFSHFLTDPTFDADISTETQLSKLPSQISNLTGGSIEGLLSANAHIAGSTSMFTPAGFQRLKVEGDIGLRDFYWLAYDTVNMVYVDRALFKFDSQKRLSAPGASTAPSLAAHIELDSAKVLIGDYIMDLSDARLGLATKNSVSKRHREVHPMGGGLKIGKFNFLSISDSIVVKVRDLGGVALIRPLSDDLRRPEFIFRLGLGRISTGDNSTRLMVSDAKLNFTAQKKPLTKREKMVYHTADSLRRSMPHLSPDSVIAMAERIHRRPSHKKYPRVHPEMVNDSSEVIDFGTSHFLRTLLTRWTLNGSLTSGRARLFTPYFPLRNRLRNINVAFNNDTVRLKDVQYKAGHSDLTFSGEITNLRRALTSRRQKSPLKIRFETISDTIDVNQLANTAFTGSAYAAKQIEHLSLSEIEDENKIDSLIGAHVADAPQQMAPLLIPRNIDLEVNCHADNILYSDLTLHRLSGTLLAYGGALNLHKLNASSEVGDVNLSALYMGRNIDSLSFGFGLKLDRFNLHKFLDLVPAVDSIMPVLRDFSGIISADIACTTPIDRNMDFALSGLNAAIKLDGSDLVLIDPETFKMLSKWLFFKDKKRNIIDHMDVQMTVENGLLNIYPFIFNIDRYKLGVQGHNDFAMNFDYHIAVLKSPMPFKFGINISGNPDKYKIRLGGAKFNEKTPLNVPFVDNTRVNLLKQIENIFRRGVRGADMKSLQLDKRPEAATIDLNAGELTPQDSLELYRQGMIPEPPRSLDMQDGHDKKPAKKRRGKKSPQKNNSEATSSKDAVIPRPE